MFAPPLEPVKPAAQAGPARWVEPLQLTSPSDGLTESKKLCIIAESSL
jgi:hypothetical protein